MKMRLLGKTGVKVSELCLGTGNFGATGPFVKFGAIGQKDANKIVSMSIDAGINFFNTAGSYSDGLSEEVLGKALGVKRKEIILTTKISSVSHPELGRKFNLSYQFIIESCNDSLRRLQTDYIDLLELHNFDPEIPLEETLKALNDLVKQGKARYIGCSNFTGWQLMKALSISDRNGWSRFIALESLYSLLARGVEFELVPVCLDQNLSIVAWSPLHGGFLSGKYRRGQPWPQGTRLSNPSDQFVSFNPDKGFDVIEELYKIAEQHKAKVSTVALSYLLQKPGVTSLITGVRTADNLKINLDAVNLELTPEEISRLDSVSEPVHLYPYSADMPGMWKK